MNESTFTSLEKEGVKYLIEFSDLSDESKEVLRKQFETAELEKRDVDGAGFFTYFTIPADVPRLDKKERIVLDAVSVDVNGVANAGALLLFVDEGVIHILEGFTQAVTEWSPYEGEPYKLKRIIWEKKEDGSKTGESVDI